MPMPHRTFAQVARRRLTGKEGRERIREVRALLDELPDYRNGPYADLRKWLLGEIEETRVRSSAVHRDSIAVRREGAAQVALVGPPNVGKSSLLQALSDIQIRTGDYAFTTLRPVPALTRIGGVLVQLVEIPGLIEGANEDRGGGRALLGVLRSADAIVYCIRADGDPAALDVVRAEVAIAGIDKPAAIAVTRADEASPEAIARLRAAWDLPVVAVSILDDASLDAFRERRLGAHRPDPRPPAARGHGGCRAPRAARGRDRGRRGRGRPPGAGVDDRGGARSGARPPGSTASASGATTSSATATSSRSCGDRADGDGRAPVRATGQPASGPRDDPALGVDGRAAAELAELGAGDLVAGVVAGPDERPRLDVPEAQRQGLVLHLGELVGVVVALEREVVERSGAGTGRW